MLHSVAHRGTELSRRFVRILVLHPPIVTQRQGEATLFPSAFGTDPRAWASLELIVIVSIGIELVQVSIALVQSAHVQFVLLSPYTGIDSL